MLFDLDDTLSDWVTAIDRAIGAALQGSPAVLPDQVWNAIREYTHESRDGRVVNRAYWKLRISPGEPLGRAIPGADAAAAAVSRFSTDLQPVPFPEAKLALDALVGRYRLAVLSNSPSARTVLAGFGFLSYFEAVVMADDPYRKPDPRAYADACAVLGLPPSVVLSVGDSWRDDVEGALAAGLQPVWVDRYDDGHELPAAVRRIVSLDELPALLAAGQR